MSDQRPADERLQALLAEVHEESAPHGAEFTSGVVRTARWQRPVRRALAGVGGVAGSLAGGFGALFLRERRR